MNLTDTNQAVVALFQQFCSLVVFRHVKFTLNPCNSKRIGWNKLRKTNKKLIKYYILKAKQNCSYAPVCL